MRQRFLTHHAAARGQHHNNALWCVMLQHTRPLFHVITGSQGQCTVRESMETWIYGSLGAHWYTGTGHSARFTFTHTGGRWRALDCTAHVPPRHPPLTASSINLVCSSLKSCPSFYKPIFKLQSADLTHNVQ